MPGWHAAPGCKNLYDVWCKKEKLNGHETTFGGKLTVLASKVSQLWNLIACFSFQAKYVAPVGYDLNSQSTPTDGRDITDVSHTTPVYQFNLRQCVRTVAKIELLEDAYDEMLRQLLRGGDGLLYFLQHSARCHWPVAYFECLDTSLKASQLPQVITRIGEVVFHALRVLQAMFIGTYRCFTHYYDWQTLCIPSNWV